MNRSKKKLLALGLGTASIGLGLGAVSTQVGATPGASTLTFPLTVVQGEPGSVHEIVSSDVSSAMQGDSCTVTAVSDNNGSVHPQSDILVTSGGDQVTLVDVEGAAGGVTTAGGELTLGTNLTVSVRLGPDGIFSGGGSVDVVCPDVSPSSTSPSTTTATSTTTAAPQAEVRGVTQSRPQVAAAVAASPGFTG